MVARKSVDAAVLGVPSHVRSDVGGNMGHDTLSDVVGDHTLGAGGRCSHAENPGVAFASGGSGGFRSWALRQGQARYIGQSQQEHIVKQHAGGISFLSNWK